MAKKVKAKKKSRATKKAGKKPAGRSPRKAAKALKGAAARAAAAPASGPVTLEEARALANAKRPQLAARAAVAAATTPQSPDAVGAERERLEKQRQGERNRRISEYKAVMDIMKARGARAPAAPRRARTSTDETDGGSPAAAAPAAGFAPLQILAEGDSWFDYPPFYFSGGGLVTRLESRLGVPILNLAKAGDEVRYMLGVEERIILTQQLTSGSPAGGPWDVVVFSGGGNDIVANPMALWVRDYNAAVPPATLLHQQRFDAALALVRAGYEDLIGLRDALSPTTHLVLHGYDNAIPDGRRVCPGFGPWLEPTFNLRRFPAALPARQAVINAMLSQFATMMTTLTGPTVTFINGQGALPQQKSSWHNELHPTRAGFDTHAALFHARLKQLFPARVA